MCTCTTCLHNEFLFLFFFGGLGVAKRIYSGGGIGVMINTAASSSTTGSLVVVGGAGVALNIYAGAAIVAEGTTASTSATTGSMLTKGGFLQVKFFED